MYKKVILFIIFLHSSILLFSQGNIYDLLNKEIWVNDTWAGQCFTLVQENNDYYVYRKIGGSGVPVIGFIKYIVIYDSPYKITFSEIIDISENLNITNLKNELFEIYCRDDTQIYLNGIKLSLFND